MAAIYTTTPLPMGVRRKGNLFQGRIVINGKRVCSPGFDTPIQAEQWLQNQREHYTSGKQGATA